MNRKKKTMSKNLFGENIDVPDYVRPIHIPKGTVLTAGYQGRNIQQFISMLTDCVVTLLVDCRSKPFSRNHQFNRGFLEKSCKNAGMSYEWIGDKLGGIGGLTEKQWTKSLKVIYDKSKKDTILLMCMEKKYTECHRQKLSEILETVYKVKVIHL